MNIWDSSETFTLPHLIAAMDSLKEKGISMDTLQSINNGNPVSAQRLFAGKNYDEQVGLFIKDEFGNPRIKIYIDKGNEPKFQVLDQKGNVIKELVGK